MSWIINDEISVERDYDSQSITVNKILVDLNIVIDKVLEKRFYDKAEEAESILFFVDATNGLIGVGLYDIDNLEEVGTSYYCLWLRKLWEMSLEHEDGSLFYDEIAESAIKEFAKSEIVNGLRKRYKLYFQDELDEALEI